MLLRRDRPDRSGEYPTGSETHARLHPHERLSPWCTDVQAIRSSRGKEIIISPKEIQKIPARSFG